MLSEALETLFEKQNDATRLVPIAVDDPRAKHFDKLGEPVAYPLPIPPRKHKVETIESLSVAVNTYASNLEQNAAVWVTLDKAVAILDDDSKSHRCDQVLLPVQPAPYFAVLEKCSATWMSQKELIDVLRHDLAGTEIDPADTLPILRNLKFATQSETTGAYTADSSRLGKQVAAQVTGESSLPEVVSIEFHPYPAISAEVNVAVVVFCTLFADPEKGKLKLAPQPGQLEAARTKATLALRETVQKAVGEDVPVFVGSP